MALAAKLSLSSSVRPRTRARGPQMARVRPGELLMHSAARRGPALGRQLITPSRRAGAGVHEGQGRDTAEKVSLIRMHALQSLALLPAELALVPLQASPRGRPSKTADAPPGGAAPPPPPVTPEQVDEERMPGCVVGRAATAELASAHTHTRPLPQQQARTAGQWSPLPQHPAQASCACSSPARPGSSQRPPPSWLAARYHHESREDLARKGAAVHEEVFPDRREQREQGEGGQH
jgi:hypothetical protein